MSKRDDVKNNQRSPLTENRPKLELIPPLSNEFRIYGGDDTIERAREWALRGHYLLVRGLPACAHGFYMMTSCPGEACHRFSQFDHTNLWVIDGTGRPFLLSHPYSDKVEGETQLYAKAHGLVIHTQQYMPDDAWYGGRTIPIRMELSPSWPVWPLEAAVHTILITQPMMWPDEDDRDEDD